MTVRPSYYLIALLAVLVALCAACRRDLWVYTDDLHQVELITDWSEATERPGGMTWWFISSNGDGRNYHGTTADVTHAWLNVPRGDFDGVVFDYSPSEYSHVEFTGMDNVANAAVKLLPAADQPQANDHLYGSLSVPLYIDGIDVNYNTGMYTIMAEPEPMNADVLPGQHIIAGYNDDHILYDQRDDYVADLVTQTLYAKPKPIVWQLYVYVEVKGLGYMNNVVASIAGLADGCRFFPLQHTDTPCMQQLTNWRRGVVNDSIGYISSTVNTFGPTEHFDGHLRLNLQFTLIDQATQLNYHFDLDDGCITIDDNRLVVDIRIPIDYDDAPNLPKVDAVNTAGFDATVTPWDDGGTADATM